MVWSVPERPCPNLHDTSITVPDTVFCVPLGALAICWAWASTGIATTSRAPVLRVERIRFSMLPPLDVVDVNEGYGRRVSPSLRGYPDESASLVIGSRAPLGPEPFAP